MVVCEMSETFHVQPSTSQFLALCLTAKCFVFEIVPDEGFFDENFPYFINTVLVESSLSID